MGFITAVAWVFLILTFIRLALQTYATLNTKLLSDEGKGEILGMVWISWTGLIFVLSLLWIIFG